MEGNKNEIAWNALFRKYDILNQVNHLGTFEISSGMINEFREARLMTKFDYRSQLPQIFKENELSILPITRGTYIIGKFDIFRNFDNETSKVIPISFPDYIESIDFNDIRSEAVALNCAFISGIIADFTGESPILPTVSGRMGSSKFDFNVKDKLGNNTTVNVNNAQIEIDGGYEGKDSLILIEAKNVISEDFVIRQLYYPFRTFKNKLDKTVRPLFVTYSNGIFHLREYYFENPMEYNSIKLLNSSMYSIIESKITEERLMELLGATETKGETQKVPFPQADDFSRIINLCELINEFGPNTKEKISDEYGFVSRQADYYSNAAIYLGLLEKDVNNPRLLRLSETGKSIFSLPLYQRQIAIIKLMIEHKPFKETLRACLTSGRIPEKSEVVEFMQSTENINIESINTFYRRAQSVISWVNWIIKLTGKLC